MGLIKNQFGRPSVGNLVLNNLLGSGPTIVDEVKMLFTDVEVA